MAATATETAFVVAAAATAAALAGAVAMVVIAWQRQLRRHDDKMDATINLMG